MFKIIEHKNGQTEIISSKTGNVVCVIYEKKDNQRLSKHSVAKRTYSYSASSSKRNTPEKNKVTPRTQFLKPSPSKRVKHEPVDSRSSDSWNKRSPSPEVVDDLDDDCVDQDTFLKTFGLVRATAAKPSSSGGNGSIFPSKQADSRSKIHHSIKTIEEVGFSSCTGQKLVQSSQRLTCNTESSLQLVGAYESYCIAHAVRVRGPALRSQGILFKFPVTFRPSKTWRQESHHCYCFNRKQRQERKIVLKTGLSKHARYLKSRCKNAQVHITRLSLAEIKKWVWKCVNSQSSPTTVNGTGICKTPLLYLHNLTTSEIQRLSGKKLATRESSVSSSSESDRDSSESSFGSDDDGNDDDEVIAITSNHVNSDPDCRTGNLEMPSADHQPKCDGFAPSRWNQVSNSSSSSNGSNNTTFIATNGSLAGSHQFDRCSVVLKDVQKQLVKRNKCAYVKDTSIRVPAFDDEFNDDSGKSGASCMGKLSVLSPSNVNKNAFDRQPAPKTLQSNGNGFNLCHGQISQAESHPLKSPLPLKVSENGNSANCGYLLIDHSYSKCQVDYQCECPSSPVDAPPDLLRLPEYTPTGPLMEHRVLRSRCLLVNCHDNSDGGMNNSAPLHTSASYTCANVKRRLFRRASPFLRTYSLHGLGARSSKHKVTLSQKNRVPAKLRQCPLHKGRVKRIHMSSVPQSGTKIRRKSQDTWQDENGMQAGVQCLVCHKRECSCSSKLHQSPLLSSFSEKRLFANRKNLCVFKCQSCGFLTSFTTQTIASLDAYHHLLSVHGVQDPKSHLKLVAKEVQNHTELHIIAFPESGN